jgi:transposase
MFHIRKTKTQSGKTAVQVVRYEQRKLIVVKHIGSADNEIDLASLEGRARQWIAKASKQQKLFADETPQLKPYSLDEFQYMGFRYNLVYETLYELCKRFRFHQLRRPLFVDLVIARIIEPCSTLQTIEYLKEYFGIDHRREYFYRQLPGFIKAKDLIESKVLTVAQNEFSFNFSFVFYDVTTLYFESFESDGLRQPGFSKDNKFNQPQIVLGLLVSADGFPVGYHLFEGNTFEGHTLIPVILQFKRKHKISTFTVVADAAMISRENVAALDAAHLQYIVGARIANLPSRLIKSISETLRRNDGATTRLKTDHGDLICDYSEKRYRKDKRELDKQVQRAEKLLDNPGSIKRAKFISSEEQTYQLNTGLIEKTTMLLGIKGYHTNLPPSAVSDRLVIEHYHSLWHVEQAFRIAKSDLQIRPVFHFKRQMIEGHILLCFMALALCKYMELKTKKSTKSIIAGLKGVTDARLVHRTTGEEFVLRTAINDEVHQLLKQLAIPV